MGDDVELIYHVTQAQAGPHRRDAAARNRNGSGEQADLFRVGSFT